MPCTLFLLLFEDFGLGQRGRGGFKRRCFLRFGNRGGHRDHRNVLVAEDFHAGREWNFVEMNRLPDFEQTDIDVDDFRQVSRQRAHFDFEQHVFQHATAGLDAGGFPDSLHRHGDRHFFVFGNFMKIHVQNFAAQRMVLHFLHQRKPLALGPAFDRQINQDGFGD